MKSYSQYDVDAYVFMLPGKSTFQNPVKSILKVLDEADRDVYYYHCPPNNNINLSLEEFDTIMAHPRLKGIKNSSSNMYLRRELLLLRQDKGYNTLFFEGQEWAADEALLVGVDGMICGMGALCSRMMKELALAADAMDVKKAVEVQNKMIRVFHGVYGYHIENCWNGQKYALQKLGLISSAYTMAQEMDSLTPEAMKRIEKCLEDYKEDLD